MFKLILYLDHADPQYVAKVHKCSFWKKDGFFVETSDFVLPQFFYRGQTLITVKISYPNRGYNVHKIAEKIWNFSLLFVEFERNSFTIFSK